MRENITGETSVSPEIVEKLKRKGEDWKEKIVNYYENFTSFIFVIDFKAKKD